MHQTLLDAYDRQLRTASEMLRAGNIEHYGPLWFADFPGGHGFVTYENLAGADAAKVEEYVGAAVDHFAARVEITAIEWKTRAHDIAPGLHEALDTQGFAAEESESIMIGEAALLVHDVVVPDGVELRQVHNDAEIFAMERMQGEVFNEPEWRSRAEAAVASIASGADIELWIALVGGRIVSAGRLEPVADTDFAGLWGGATVPEWRGSGIYRALTACRARSALERGKKYLNSDCTEFSRPILERSGLVKVSMTTPYVRR